MLFSRRWFGIAAFLLLCAFSVSASDEAMLMRFPDIYKNTVTFSYAGDIWVSDINGGYARRLTTSPGVEFFPKFSPDGKWIAFTGQYDGYFQVFVIPAEGGEARQLTFYPYPQLEDRHGFPNQVMEWTPDGKYIVFRSMEYHWNSSYGRYCKISPEGGWPEPLPLVEGSTMSFSPDGRKIAFNRNYRDWRTWKRYKGGRERNIWIYDFDKDTIEKITSWPGEEINPIWHTDKIYFVADETGVFNLYCYDIATKEIKRLTDYKDWDVRWPGFDNESIVFELGGKLYRMTFQDEKISPLKIQVAFDKSNLNSSYREVSENIEDFDLAPGGKRAAFTARGEIFTVPAEKGDIRNLSNTPGVRERSAVWSPDGKWLAYIADSTGNEELYITDPLGRKTTQLTKNSKAINQFPVWSPDSKKIAYRDAARNFYYIDIAAKKITLVDSSEQGLISQYSWAPDSRWLAYIKQGENKFPLIYIYGLETAKKHQVTNGLLFDTAPAFDPEGKYLYFISLRDFNPIFGNFELNFVYTTMARMYMIMLKPDIPNPLGPESDEVEPVKEEKAEKGKDVDKDKKDADKEKDKDKKKKPVKVEIEFQGLAERVAVIPVGPAQFRSYAPVEGGVIYIKSAGAGRRGGPGDAQGSLFCFDLKEKKETEMLQGVTAFTISPDNKKILYAIRNSYGIADVKFEKIDTTKGKMNVKGMNTLIDPIIEWKQMLVEAWRLEKNFFYVANMHGVDWDKILKKYLPLVDGMSHRRDLTYVIGEMIGELCAGHTYVGGGDMPEVENTSIGLLGADLEPDSTGYFRIKRIFCGENWRTEARSPLTEPGIKASDGDYILEINGKPLRLPENPYHLLQKTLGKIIVLKLNSKPEPNGAWEVKIMPIQNEVELKYVDWVELNKKKVEQATNGKVGYIHIPDMGFHGLNQFVKMWYSQLRKEGIIIDERFNGGGFVSGMILERLRRFVVGMSQGRIFGTDTVPTSAYSGYMVMLINSYAASDGDIFPNFFREYKLGPIIGTRTWGGVIGIGGYTPLMDGGYVTIPVSGLYSLESEWIVENVGVSPDIEVDNMPQDVAKGKDEQLDKAIELIMKEIQEKPVKFPPQPPDPVR